MHSRIVLRACALALLASNASCSTSDTTSSSSDAPGSFDAAGLDTAGFDAAGLDTTGLDTTGLDVSALDTAVTDAAQADASCAAGSWRDYAAAKCVDCSDAPRPVVCADLDLGKTPTSTRWDDATKTVTVVVSPGKAEIVSGTLNYGVFDSALPTHKKVAMGVAGNELTAVLEYDAAATSIDIAHITVTERCGGTYDLNLDAPLRPADGGPGFVASFYCGS